MGMKTPGKRENHSPKAVAESWLIALLQKVQSKQISLDEAVAELSILPYEDIGHTKLDHHRSLRTGFPEVIFGQGKTKSQLVSITERMAARADKVLITRANEDAFQAVKARVPDAVYNPEARTIVVNRARNTALRPGITVITGGTADIPVAEEAAITAELMGNQVERVFDVGVAGIHRLLNNLEQIRRARVLVVVAGMDGVLPAVVGGLVTCPVIAVPTSTGYGASFGGIAPLLTMLNSCAPGVAVVNIDGGFNAGYMAGVINRC
jgi:pyridinium-3,5-biscarboxylic acid mononucleotide synthase